MKSWPAVSTRVRIFALIGALCAAIQIGSAFWLVRDFTSPNASTALARRLAADGTLSVDAWRQLRGPGAAVPTAGLRAYHLPGEPLYLGLGLRITPVAWHPFLHLPVVLLFVLAVTWVAGSLGGAPTALAAGTIASIDPFVVRHGPVWDDTFLAAALAWLVLGVLVSGLREDRPPRLPRLLVLAAAAGWAAVTRPEAGVVGLLAGALALVPAARRIRSMGWAVMAGAVAAIAGWGIRNLLVLGVLFFGTSHDGKTLYESNYAFARQSLMATGSVSSFSQTHMDELHARATNLDEVGTDRLFRQTAWSYIATHPLEVLETATVKIAVSLTGSDPSASWVAVRNVIAVGFNVLLMVSALIGAPRLMRRIADAPVRSYTGRVALVIGLVTMASLALGPAGLRYRMLAAGLFYLGAAGLVASIWPGGRAAAGGRRSTA